MQTFIMPCVQRSLCLNEATDNSSNTRVELPNGVDNQFTTNNGTLCGHIDFKTAFLQGQSCGVNPDVVCQLSPEAGRSP